jgi:biopolymer transport protein TolR
MIAARLKRNRRGGRRAGGGSHNMPALVPMIDMLTIMVVYLLVHAADYDILPNAKKISIPQSISEQKPHESTTVTVTKDTIYVNGAAVVPVAEVAASNSAIVEPLRITLKGEAQKRLLLRADDPTAREVTVLADKSLPYSVLKKIMTTCTAANYGKMSLAVIEKERAYRGPNPV